MSEQQDGSYPLDHNHPPPDIHPEKLVVVDDVLALLTKHYKALLDDRKEKHLGAIDDWVEDHTPPGKAKAKPAIGDEQDLMDAIDLVKQVREFLTEVEAVRKKVKGPVDRASSEIQQYFADGIAKVLKDALTPIVDAQSLALRAKEERERQRLRQEAWEKEQELQRLAILAARAKGVRQEESLVQQAMKVEDEVQRLEAKAAGSVADLTRTRTDLGQVTGLRSTWKFRVVDLMKVVMLVATNRLPIEWLMINEVHANRQIRPQSGVRDVAGLEIFEEKTAR